MYIFITTIKKPNFKEFKIKGIIFILCLKASIQSLAETLWQQFLYLGRTLNNHANSSLTYFVRHSPTHKPTPCIFIFANAHF